MALTACKALLMATVKSWRRGIAIVWVVRMPCLIRVGVMMSPSVFCVACWNSDPRQVRMIPEICRFHAADHEAGPGWLNFCNVELDTPRAMTLCCPTA